MVAEGPSVIKSTGMSQQQRILQAYREGSRTAPEVAAILGLTSKIASACSGDLERRGLLVRTGFGVSHGPGPRPVFYEPK